MRVSHNSSGSTGTLGHPVRSSRDGTDVSISEPRQVWAAKALLELFNLAASRTFEPSRVDEELASVRQSDSVRDRLDEWRKTCSPEEVSRALCGLKEALESGYAPSFPFVNAPVENPDVTVIVPVFNKDTFLPECLFSVLVQSRKNIEIICVDDGSSDGSAVILDWFSSRDRRMVVIHQANKGAFAARNRALEAARGEFVCFLDPDDWYPDFQVLERLYREAKDSGVSLCGGSFSFYENQSFRTDFSGFAEEYTFLREGMVSYSDYQFDFGYTRFLYSRTFLRTHEIRFPPLVRYEDPPFFVKAMVAAGRFMSISRVVYRYRVGYKTVDWAANGCRSARDKFAGMAMVADIAIENGLDSLLRLTLSRINEDFAFPWVDQRLRSIETSLSYRVGRAVTWPLRMGYEFVGWLRTRRGRI